MITRSSFQVLKTDPVFTILLVCLALILTSCGSQGVNSSTEEPLVFEKEITMEGGTGKAFIKSPVTVTQFSDHYEAVFVWSSKNYDYMIVDGVRYENEAGEGEDSRFTVSVPDVENPLTVIGDTTAMSVPHEIDYVIYWDGQKESGEAAGALSPIGNKEPEADGPAFFELKKTGELETRYAKGFHVTYYDGYSLIEITNNASTDRYLLVNEGSSIPQEIPSDISIIKAPVEKTYVASTSVMDLIRQTGSLEKVRFSCLRKEDWYVKEASDAIARGDMLYAGKYSAPDYELILSEGCDLAIENTMIYHKPEVKEKLEELGIPVMVERSSYESHPMGRLEWIKLYGLLYDKEKEVSDFCEKEFSAFEALEDAEQTDKKVAFFSVSATGMINVRKPGDYISKMIGLAGGSYVFPGEAVDENALSTMNIQMEDFYRAALDADILIYNSTIEGEISTISDLKSKNSLFSDFKAVKSGRVYCADKSFFQQPTGIMDFMSDLSNVIHDKNDGATYLKRLDP